MKKPDKIILFFVLLIGLGFSVCTLALFYPIPVISGAVRDNMADFPWLNDVFVIFIAVLCLCFFILLLVVIFAPSQSGFLDITKSKGKLQFSKRTVESTCRYSFADLTEISSSIIKTKIYKAPDKTKVYIKLSLSSASELASLTEAVQEKVTAAMLSSLGVTVKSVTVKVIDVGPGSMDKMEKKEDIEEESPVISVGEA